MREKFAVEWASKIWDEGNRETRRESRVVGLQNECRIDLEWLSNCSTSFLFSSVMVIPFILYSISYSHIMIIIILPSFHSPLSHLPSCGIHRMTKLRREESREEMKERKGSKFHWNHATDIILLWAVNPHLVPVQVTVSWWWWKRKTREIPKSTEWFGIHGN